MLLRINEIAVVKRVFESDNLTKQIVKSSNPTKPVTTVKLLIQKQVTMNLSIFEGSIRDEALSDYEVSPPDETALATAVLTPALRRLEPSHLGPTMTGPAESEERRGMIPHGRGQLASAHRRDREVPEPRRGESEYGPGNLI